jgi:hypothetical protein
MVVAVARAGGEKAQPSMQAACPQYFMHLSLAATLSDLCTLKHCKESSHVAAVCPIMSSLLSLLL